MTTHFSAMTWCTHYSHDIGERKNGLIGSCPKFCPVSYMLFRPEEMDATSCKRPVCCPFPQRNINIPANSIRVHVFDDAVAHNDPNRLAAIQARRINLYCLSRKYPADRQGFKTSLCKPFLMSIHGKAILSRLIVEWSK
jgi:hypothetical protein